MGSNKKGKKATEKPAPIGKPEEPAAPDRKGSFTLGPQPRTVGRVPVEAHKFETAPSPSAEVAPATGDEDLGELPTTYSDDTIFLIARDPRWLFTYWDVNFYAIPAEATKDAARQFFLKIYSTSGGDEKWVRINPQARNWYLPVDRSGEEYWIEMGYFDQSDTWKAMVTSGKALTPGHEAQPEEAPAEDDFVTVPAHLTFQHLLDTVKKAMTQGESLLSAVSRLQGEGRRLSFLPGAAPDWTSDQRRILATLLGREMVDQMGLGSDEIDRLLRQHLTANLDSGLGGGLLSGLLGGASELFGAVESSLFSGIGASWSAQPFSQAGRGFFMHVNAEVIFYGGTHPEASVTIDGQPVPLQPDGSFRYHFKFPDGNFEIPIVATSPDGLETRKAVLEFNRETARTGDIGSTAQPPELPGEPMGRR